MCEGCCNIFNFYLPRDVMSAVFCSDGRVLTAHYGRILINLRWKPGEFEYLMSLLSDVRQNKCPKDEAQQIWLMKLHDFARDEGRWRRFYTVKKKRDALKRDSQETRTTSRSFTSTQASYAAQHIKWGIENSIDNCQLDCWWLSKTSCTVLTCGGSHYFEEAFDSVHLSAFDCMFRGREKPKRNDEMH